MPSCPARSLYMPTSANDSARDRRASFCSAPIRSDSHTRTKSHLHRYTAQLGLSIIKLPEITGPRSSDPDLWFPIQLTKGLINHSEATTISQLPSPPPSDLSANAPTHPQPHPNPYGRICQ
ncbi:unnamed protein product [Protopolystoma xenopodis]|uniref:Uncharacterized protein n=1 Tax=Protopolystoma xenopodis TaxID=117903 RepID=A0A448X4Z4_9PLAT|nr:unnamed protein product [Protopolystoma xenopodis]